MSDDTMGTPTPPADPMGTPAMPTGTDAPAGGTDNGGMPPTEPGGGTPPPAPGT